MMKAGKTFRLVMGRGTRSVRAPKRAKRKLVKVAPGTRAVTAAAVIRALKATAGSKELIARFPGLGMPKLWSPTATFSVCRLTGTASNLDFFQCDHRDVDSSMQQCLANCFAQYVGDMDTAGRIIRCMFGAPQDGNYVCNVQLQSPLAAVRCRIDGLWFNTLPFAGTINQPHPATLLAGNHYFEIRPVAGDFRFLSLTVWNVLDEPIFA